LQNYFALVFLVLFTLKIVFPLTYAVQLIKVKFAKDFKLGHRRHVPDKGRQHVYDLVKFIPNAPLVYNMTKYIPAIVKAQQGIAKFASASDLWLCEWILLSQYDLERVGFNPVQHRYLYS